VIGDEVLKRRGRLATTGACLGKFGRDLVARVARPTLCGVKSDDADRRGILSFKQVADHNGAVCVAYVSLGQARPPNAPAKSLSTR
jgi:hypothetical protein